MVDGTILRTDGAPVGAPWGSLASSTIDKIFFRVNTAGTITMDVLSWEWNYTTNMRVDVNGDGEFAFLDPEIRLFRDDGSLDAGDHLGSNDDSSSTFADGSVDRIDSFMSMALPVGDYILCIGAHSSSFTIANAIAGMNPAAMTPATTNGTLAFTINDHGDYRVTFTGDVSIIPAPWCGMWLGLGGLLAKRSRRTA
ncbi:MAG: DVUA0089 family protein [Phycisphaerae bacterium]|nr:DVUA0089 family protein [Phycisphaerae bacterium]